MKKKTGYLIFASLSLLIVFMFYSINSKSNELKIQKERISIMPNFSFSTLSGDTISNKGLDSDEYTLIIYFSTKCSFCTYQIENLLKEHRILENTKILLVSTENPDTVSTYSNEYNLTDYEPEIAIAVVKDSSFLNVFGKYPTPSLILYDKSKKLLLSHKGALSMDSIKTYY